MGDALKKSNMRPEGFEEKKRTQPYLIHIAQYWQYISTSDPEIGSVRRRILVQVAVWQTNLRYACWCRSCDVHSNI